MLVSIPSKISVSSFVEYLKGKSTLIIFERHANLKYKYGKGEFGVRSKEQFMVSNNNGKKAKAPKQGLPIIKPYRVILKYPPVLRVDIYMHKKEITVDDKTLI